MVAQTESKVESQLNAPQAPQSQNMKIMTNQKMYKHQQAPIEHKKMRIRKDLHNNENK